MQVPLSSRRTLGFSDPIQWVWVLLALIVVGLLGVIVVFRFFRPITVLPRLQLAPGYLLTAENGQPLTSEDRRGKMTLYSFVDALCSENCAQSASQIVQLQNSLIEKFDSADLLDGIDWGIITLTLNPEHDTHAVLQTTKKMALNGKESARWHLVRGDAQTTKLIAGSGFGLYYQMAPQQKISYSPRWVLVDGMGVVRSNYYSAEPDSEIVARDMEYIAREARQSRGVAKLAYEAAHLFACYPK